ncbi:Lipase 3 [Camponotus floridanus]|uniref:Lipase 3 n=1 Tax=Camponotus floridanus TaxID=104421 RepID=E2B1V0_CAMFO|nr:Lipase 3 [Camponotus floridanus]
MIREAGHPVETHVITTEDGYLLTLHRIPGGNDSLPVPLQHGFLSSSADWVILGRGKALGMISAELLKKPCCSSTGKESLPPGIRCNVNRYPSSVVITFHEMGIYDLPAMITFITNKKSQPLHTYIGHSMGAISFFIMASERPEIARMVQMMIGLSPAVFLNHMKSPIQYFFPFRRELKIVAQLFFHDEFLRSDFLRFFLKIICDQNITGEFCINLISIINGDDREQFNNTLMPVILNHFPSGTSIKTLLHLIQTFESGKFRKYDHDRVKNLLIYNSMEPPDYNLSNTTVPIALFYANNDLFVSIEDVERLYHPLANVVDMYEVPWSKFNHVDFLCAKDAPKLVYDRIFQIIRGENLNNVTSVK